MALRAEGSGETEQQACALLGQFGLMRERGTFVVRQAEDSVPDGCVFYWDIVGPADRPVTITAAHAAIDVFGILAPVRIVSAHGRVSVLETSGDIDVTVTRGGHIVWAGRQGRVRLDAPDGDGDIDLKLTATTYDGSLDATAGQSIRAVLPRGLTSAFEVRVARDDQFVCRADVRPLIRRREDAGRVVLTYGSGEPALRFISLEGLIAVDHAS